METYYVNQIYTCRIWGRRPAKRGRRGQDDSQSFLRVLDMGGMVWEGKSKYKSVDAALDDLEAALEKIIEEIG